VKQKAEDQIMLGKHVMWWSTECTLHTQHRRATAMKPGIRGNIPNSKLPVEKCVPKG
jgi:hypothetical protein